MKIVLAALNAKYIHSNLALRYLRGVCTGHEVSLREYSINDRLDLVAGELYKLGAEVIGLSCYIWNLSETLELADTLRQVCPESIIVLGGPEVSFDPGEYLANSSCVDYVVYGEGEETFRELLDYLSLEPASRDKAGLGRINGIAYRTGEGVCVNPPRALIRDLDSVPSPYLDFEGLENKIAYVESTRGCPFSCQYCLSSTFQGVRFFPLERTKRELEGLIEAGVTQVKFVDRTFNCNKDHAMQLWAFLAQWKPQANFHFEISADLLEQEELDFLGTVRPGLFQFEVGVQSTNLHTLELIERRTNLSRLAENVRSVARKGNILQLLDLIAGLPGEDYYSFAASFDEVYSWGPDKLQLGFLKLLKGAGIREKAAEWGYRFTTSPPYKVLGNNWLEYGELLRLQIIEDLVDKYFNSGRFVQSLAFLIAGFSGPFSFFEALAGFWEDKGYHRQSHNAKVLFELLLEFYQSCYSESDPVFAQLLQFDYLLWAKPPQRPAWFPESGLPGSLERGQAFLHSGLLRLLPQLAGVSRREINKYFCLEHFSREIIPFLEIDFIPDSEEPLSLLFYYPGPLISAGRPGYIPVVI